MDTTRIIDPVADRLAKPAATIASAVGGAATVLADQVSDRVDDLDLAHTARRTRRFVARAIPWDSAPWAQRSRPRGRRWLIAAVVVVTVGAAVVILQRRSAGTEEAESRDDWTTTAGSTNGTAPAGTAERQPVTSSH